MLDADYSRVSVYSKTDSFIQKEVGDSSIYNELETLGYMPLTFGSNECMSIFMGLKFIKEV